MQHTSAFPSSLPPLIIPHGPHLKGSCPHFSCLTLPLPLPLSLVPFPFPSPSLSHPTSLAHLRTHPLAPSRTQLITSSCKSYVRSAFRLSFDFDSQAPYFDSVDKLQQHLRIYAHYVVHPRFLTCPLSGNQRARHLKTQGMTWFCAGGLMALPLWFA